MKVLCKNLYFKRSENKSLKKQHHRCLKLVPARILFTQHIQKKFLNKYSSINY